MNFFRKLIKYSFILMSGTIIGCAMHVTNFQSNAGPVAENDIRVIKKRPLVCAVMMPKNSNAMDFSTNDKVHPWKMGLVGNIGNFVAMSAVSELGRICSDGVVVTTSEEIAGSVDVVIFPILTNTQIGLLESGFNKLAIGVVHSFEFQIYIGDENRFSRSISSDGSYIVPENEIEKLKYDVNGGNIFGDFNWGGINKWYPYYWSKASAGSVLNNFKNLVLYIDKNYSNQLTKVEAISGQPGIIQRKISALSKVMSDEKAEIYLAYSSQNSFVTDTSYIQKKMNDSSMITGALVGSAMKMMPNSNVSALGSVIDKMHESGPSELRDAYNIGRGGGGAQTLSALRSSEATTKRVANECEAMGAKLRASTNQLSNEKIGCEELKNVNTTIAGLLNNNATCSNGSEISSARRNFDITTSLIKRKCGS